MDSRGHIGFWPILQESTILICTSPILFSPKEIHKSQYISQRIRIIYTFSSTSPFNNGARAYYHIIFILDVHSGISYPKKYSLHKYIFLQTVCIKFEHEIWKVRMDYV